MIGVAAPALAIMFRLIQGFALGGEIGPNTAYLVEAAPAHRRGLYVSFQYMSQDASILVSGLVGFFLASNFSDAQLDAWGWRAAFLVGATIVPFGLILRRQLAETLPQQAETGPRTRHLTPQLWRIAALGFLMLAGGTVVSYLQDYLTTYATSTLHMATRTGFLATVTVGLFGVIFDPIGGWLSDRFGRKPVMIIPWAMLLVVAVPGFWWVSTHRTAPALIGLTIAIVVTQAIATASVLVAVTESMPSKIRCGALGLTYALAISVFGGTTQFMVAWLTRVTSSPLAPAWYMTGAVAIGLLAMLAMPETAPVKTAAKAS